VFLFLCPSIKHLDGLHVLTGLTSLSFNQNKVEHIPLSFAALTALTELKCDQNPMTSPPQHVIALGPEILVRYLAARAALLSENLRDAFSVFDDDNSGSVNRKELIEGLEKVNLKVPNDEIIKLVEEHDDGNGLIDFEEFRAIMLQLVRKRSIAKPEGADADSGGEQVEAPLMASGVQGHRDSAAVPEQEDEVLDLSMLGMTEYSIDLDEPEHVTVLNLAHNRLVDMPVVSKLKHLRELILDDNLFVNMPETIFKLRTLRRLSVQRCKLTWLPEALFSYQGLEELRLDGNHMISLPCDLVIMSSLKVLTLGNNPFRDPLKSITHEGMEYTMAYLRFFYNAREFGVLDLKEMDFLEMPYESDVKQIKELILCRNRFQVAPELLKQAAMLTSLDLSGNYLEKFESDIWLDLTNLVSLRLSNNRLLALARTIGKLVKLETFWCDENTIEELPNTLSSLCSLRFFDLTHNRLQNLHESAGGMTKLEHLNLNRNKLLTLPPEIKGMTSLRVLLARGNDMESIPDVWDHLNLTQLDLSRNPLKEIPLSVGAMFTCMQEISIDRVLHLDDPPDNMVSRGTKPLLGYLQKQYFARKTKDLVLSSFHLSKITVPLQQLDNICGGLRTLDVSHNNLQELPRNIGMCAFLEALLVRDNRLSEFPQSAKQMKTLTHLDAAGNSFDTVPEMLTYTPNIKILDLSRNNIKSLYRTVDDVTSAGFSDALSMGKRAKTKKKAEDFDGRRLRYLIDTKVMDRVSAKLRSENRSKQVGALFQLYHLEKLNLASNHVSLLPGTVARFSMLKELNMSHNELHSVPPDIGDLRRLRRMDLSHNDLYGIPMEVGKLQKVSYMNVSFNKLLELPNEIGNMTSLAELNFESNQLVFLPVTLEALETCLTRLNADGNRILDPPAEILYQGRDSVFTYFRRVRNGQKCRALVLIEMKLEVLELNWANLTVLTSLELSGNHIRVLPETILQLTNLVTLIAAGNSLERMFDAENVSEFSNLTRLALKENHITAVESYIGDLVKLKDLDLSCNRISQIAPQIEKCTNIRTLNLAQNQLDNLPRNVFRIPELTHVDVSNNSLKGLPNAICYCLSIVELRMSHNSIESLPNDIGNLIALEMLDVSANRLRALPPSIKHCDRLKHLELSSNKMSFVPSEIKKLKRLKYLAIKDNDIISVPLEIKDLQKLEKLEIDGNIFLSAPSSVKDLPQIQEISVNAAQTSALFFGGTDITPVLNVKEISDERITLSKVSRAHVLTGIESMSGYLHRLDQRESLPSLNLTHLKLTFLPQEVFRMTCLTVLDVKENEIEFLPETISWLSKLVQLDLSVRVLLACVNARA
jgi:Leucine-rich repeat (LRR) protein